MARDLLVVSLGNPSPQYDRTRHSAGHTALHALAAHIDAPSFERTGKDYARARITQTCRDDVNVMLWQSPSYMNESGPAVLSAWRAFCADNARQNAHLVVLHDEIEEVLGKMKTRQGAGYGARGHNGLRSILKISELAKLDTTRVGVGIGPRPQSRDPEVVASFVLSKMSTAELQKVEGLAADIWQTLVKRAIQ